ncbi:ribonuclease H-like domain-containing protein [Tanacetum coccineum]
MEGVDRLNELKGEMLVNNIMSRLDCTTKEVSPNNNYYPKTMKKTSDLHFPHLFFSNGNDFNEIVVKETNLHDYISFIDNTLNKCPTNLNLKKFKLDIDYSSLVNSEFKSRANSWIRYAIRRNVEEVDLWLFDVGVGQDFTFEDELFFNTSCITRMTLSFCRFNPPNGAISWERLESLCLSCVILDDNMIGKIISGSPCLEYLELKDCHGYRRIDVTSKSVKKLVLFEYYCGVESEEDIIDCIKINAPYISSLTIKGELLLRELVLLNVSSLVEVDLKYTMSYREFVIFAEEVFIGALIMFTFALIASLIRLKAGSDTSDVDRAENGDREEQIASSVWCGDHGQLMLAKKLLTLHRASEIAEIEFCFFGKRALLRLITSSLKGLTLPHLCALEKRNYNVASQHYGYAYQSFVVIARLLQENKYHSFGDIQNNVQYEYQIGMPTMNIG